jgi:hypothetical protein
MWPLDHNLPHIFYAVLKDRKLECQSANYAGFDALTNGSLTSAAVSAGFTAILTRDVNFPVDAKEALDQYPDFCVVIVRFKQHPPATLRQRFENSLDTLGKIAPVAGVCYWPGTKTTF